MLTIVVLGGELYDESKNEFYSVGDYELVLEHSLASLSKWESIHERAYLSAKPKSLEDIFSYIKCMSMDPKTPREIFDRLSEKNIVDINDYVNARMTATYFQDFPGSSPSNEVITAELIYYWIVSFQIPWEAQHWHLNRLFALLRVCSMKNGAGKKMDKAQIAQRNAQLNAERLAKLGTTG